jgi:SAM-dependent methyltransferase
VPDGWESTRCCVCGETRAKTLFDVGLPGATEETISIVKCVQCGLRRLESRPQADQLRRFYGAHYYAYGGRTRPAWKQTVWDFLRDAASGVSQTRLATYAGPLSRRITAWLLDVNIEIPHDEPRPRVVDVGCGYGDLLVYLQSRGCSVLGVEYDAAAAQRGAEYGVQIHVGELADLKLADASVDVAILQHSLEHVPAPDHLVEELGRVVRRGGTVHIAVPNGDAAGLSAEREAWGFLSFPLHFWYFDRDSLETLLSNAGFDVVEARSRTIWANHWRLWRAETGSSGLAAASRRIGRFMKASAGSRGGGDILRVVAERRET